MNATIRNAALGLLALGLLAGCSRDGAVTAPGTDAAQDRVEIAAALAAAPETVDETLFEAADVAEMGAPEGALAAVHPLRFWRRIDSVERRFEYAFADTDSTGRPTRAIVTVHRRMRGVFHLLAATVTDDDTSARVVRKPLEDHAVRRIALHRVRRPDRDRPVWRVAATSGVEIVSAPREAAPGIVSVRLVAGALDTTIADPRALFRLRHIVRLEPGVEARVVVTTEAPDDVVVLMRHRHRVPLRNHGDGTHSFAWTVGDEPGLRHLGVDAFARGTLFDDAAPYASNAWIVPYAVRAEELVAEYRP